MLNGKVTPYWTAIIQTDVCIYTYTAVGKKAGESVGNWLRKKLPVLWLRTSEDIQEAEILPVYSMYDAGAVHPENDQCFFVVLNGEFIELSRSLHKRNQPIELERQRAEKYPENDVLRVFTHPRY